MMLRFQLRLHLLVIVLMTGFGLLLYRLYHLQLVRHAEFVDRVPVARQERARIPGVRGEIRDRNGVVLATNRASFEVRVNLKEMLDEYARQARIKKTTVPTITVEFNERGITRQKTEADVVTIFKELIENRLAELGLAIAETEWQAMRVHYRSFAGVIPWVYRDNLTFSEFSVFAEHNLSLPGVTVTERGTRLYPFGAMACHLLGYVRLPDDKRVDSRERQGWDYYLPDDYGGAGVEKAFDQQLRGRAGERIMQKNVRGRIVGEVKEAYIAPQKGNDVYLTLDARIQYIAEKALRDGGIGRGAVVVLQPTSGDVLAMASVPDFDPNRFIPSISVEDWAALNTKDKTLPLLNRCIQAFIPGSTYKVPVALAGCLAGIQGNSYNCSGSVTYGTKPMQCWIQRQNGGSHGGLGLSDALMRSCNCFFYHYGNAAGIENITRVGQLLGLGERTGIEIGEEERTGILPNPQWLQQNKPLERWSSGYTANTSIGQGQVLATPLQMASVAAAVATGKCWRPHLLHEVRNGTKIIEGHQPQLRADLLSLFKPEQLETVRRGMWKVVNDAGGTAKTARIKGIEVAGKTGTAQNWRIDEKGERVEDNHTLFISFAPYENPKFAICVIVQGGKSGGGCAAPVAHRVLEQSFALDQGYDPQIQPLNEVPGNFNKIEAVTYEAPSPALAVAVNDDGDTGSGSSEQVVRDLQPQASTTPNLRPKVSKPSNSPAPSARRTLAPLRFFKRLFGGQSN